MGGKELVYATWKIPLNMHDLIGKVESLSRIQLGYIPWHPSLMKDFFMVFSNLGYDLIFSLDVNKKPLLSYSFTFIITLSFLPPGSLLQL